MTKNARKYTGLTVFIITAAVIVGYAVYTGIISGEEISTRTTQEFEGSVAALPGFRFTEDETVTHAAEPVVMRPEINPLRMILSFDLVGRGSSAGIKGVEYTFSPADEDGNPVWKKSGFRRPDEKSDRNSVGISFKVFDIESAGNYYIMGSLRDSRSFKPVYRRRK